MKPAIGRIVIVKGFVSNDSDRHPAIITRVWNDDDPIDEPVRINATIFADAGSPYAMTSIPLFDTEEKAIAARAAGAASMPHFAFWPPR